MRFMGKGILRASLTGTFLQDSARIVTLILKGHSLSPRSCQPTRSAPSEEFGTNKTVEACITSKHVPKHEARQPTVRKEFRLDSNDFGFICDSVMMK